MYGLHRYHKFWLNKKMDLYYLRYAKRSFWSQRNVLWYGELGKTNQVVIWHKVSTLFWMKIQVYLLSTPTWSFLFRLNQRNVTWIFMQLCARHIAKLCIEYYVPMYIWKKFFEFMMEFFFFFVLNLNYCEIQISCCCLILR